LEINSNAYSNMWYVVHYIFIYITVGNVRPFIMLDVRLVLFSIELPTLVLYERDSVHYIASTTL